MEIETYLRTPDGALFRGGLFVVRDPAAWFSLSLAASCRFELFLPCVEIGSGEHIGAWLGLGVGGRQFVKGVPYEFVLDFREVVVVDPRLRSVGHFLW